MKRGEKKYTIPVALAAGTLTSVITMLAAACITAWLVNTDKLGEASMGYGALVILAVSAVAGSALAVAMSGGKRLVVCALSGISYLALLLASTALFFGGQYQGVGVTALVIIACALAVGLLGIKGNKTRRGTRYKIRNR